MVLIIYFSSVFLWGDLCHSKLSAHTLRRGLRNFVTIRTTVMCDYSNLSKTFPLLQRPNRRTQCLDANRYVRG
jgi:hypothetical protein